MEIEERIFLHRWVLALVMGGIMGWVGWWLGGLWLMFAAGGYFPIHALGGTLTGRWVNTWPGLWLITCLMAWLIFR